MPRAFSHPDTLSQDDVQTLGEVRRSIWIHAMQGGVMGMLSGYCVHTVVSLGQKRGLWKVFASSTAGGNRNTALLSVLVGGCLGSYVMATTTGQNQVHALHPIFAVGAKERDDVLRLAKERDSDIRYLESHNKNLTPLEQDIADRLRRDKNRLYRRATMSQHIMEHGGLSDAHGGHWVTDEDDEDENEDGGQVENDE